MPSRRACHTDGCKRTVKGLRVTKRFCDPCRKDHRSDSYKRRRIPSVCATDGCSSTGARSRWRPARAGLKFCGPCRKRLAEAEHAAALRRPCATDGCKRLVGRLRLHKKRCSDCQAALVRARKSERYRRLGGNYSRRDLWDAIDRDGPTCGPNGGGCGEPLWGPGEPHRLTAAIHADHIIPAHWGGKTTLANIQAMHATCNMRKGARLDA